MNDVEMISITSRLRSMIEEIVNDAIDRLPISIPAKVASRSKSTVSVVPVITFGGLDAARIDDVPIAKSPYFNEPIKAGDFGLLIPCSYFYQSIVTDSLNEVKSVIPTVTTGNYIFVPLARVGDNPSTGIESEIWSKGKSRTLTVKDDKIQLGGTTGNATEYAALNTALQSFIAIFNAHVHTSSAPGSPTTSPVTPATLDISASKVAGVTL